jgi:hypothetical protein
MEFVVKIFVAYFLTSKVWGSPTFISPFSTEPLSWSTPTNVTITHFHAKNPLSLPLTQSVMLRVYTSPACASIDSDVSRSMWWVLLIVLILCWADFLTIRHVPHENAVALGNIAASDLPVGINPKMLGLNEANGDCSGIAFLPSGFKKGSIPDPKHVAPSDSQGMPAFVSWVSGALRTYCIVKNPLSRDLALFWVDDGLDAKELMKVWTRAPALLVLGVFITALCVFN